MTIIDIERPAVVSEEQPAVVATAPPAELTPAALPVRPPRSPRRPLWGDLSGPLSRTWGFALVAAWVVVVAVGIAIEPAPADPNASVPLVVDMVSTGLLATWGAMVAGVFQRRRFAAAASLVGGVGLLALTIGCPVSGHHGGFGAWWGIQMVGALALLALSGKALRASSSRP